MICKRVMIFSKAFFYTAPRPAAVRTVFRHLVCSDAKPQKQKTQKKNSGLKTELFFCWFGARARRRERTTLKTDALMALMGLRTSFRRC